MIKKYSFSAALPCLMLLLSTAVSAADKYVCDRPQNGHTCNYSNRQLQRAFDEANPGDTFYLEAGATYSGSFIFRTHAPANNPITVTSSRADWLPGPNTRITPADLPNLPTLLANLPNQPALSGAPDRSKQPPSNWRFIGVAFTAATAGQFDNSIIHTGGMGVSGWKIENASQLPEGLVFDRIYVSPRLDDSLVVQNGVRLNGKNLTLKNSFIWPIFCAGIECHAVSTQTNPGPLNITNNFISAASIPFFTGGTDPDYPEAAVPAHVTLRYNYMFRPLKWWANPGNPERAYFLKNGSKQTCTKNLLEFKSVDGAVVEYNVHENIWSDNYCMGQWFGFAATPRQSAWESPAAGGSWGASLSMGTLTSEGTAFSWTGGVDLQPGQAICIVDASKGHLYDCHKITSSDKSAKTGTIKTPFVLKVNQSKSWIWVSDTTPMLRDLTMQNEVFRNVSGGFNILARDRGSMAGSDDGRIVRLIIRNTLLENTLAALSNSPALRIFTQEVNFTSDPDIGGQDIVFEHNTFVWKNGAYNVIYFVSGDVMPVAKIKNLTIRSNIFPDAGGDVYALGGSSVGFNDWGVADHFATGASQFTSNQLWHVTENGCKNAVCRKNFSDTFAKTVRFIPNTYKIQPGSALYKAGHDGTDVGVNYDALPLIKNLTVTPEAAGAMVQFDLATPVADAAQSQPCVLEVSRDENLHSYLGAYTVTNDLNPAFFKQADASNRHNASLPPITVTKEHVKWQLGLDASAKGDDGVTHDLRYAPGTQYWGRLMCYGDTQRLQFHTLAAH